MKSMIKPPLVLTIICSIVAGLLVLVYNITYVDNTGIVTDEMKAQCQKILSEDEFFILTAKTDGEDKSVLTFGNVQNVIKAKGNHDAVIMNVVADGYEKDGINALVGLDKNGEVIDVVILSLKETPSLGTKIDDVTFLEKFKGKTNKYEIMSVDGVSAATYSSNGLKNAVAEAQEQMLNNKGAIFGE